MHRIERLRRQDYFADGAAKVVVNRQLKQKDMRMHGHEFAELVIVLSGEGAHVTGGTRHHVRTGDVLFINSSRSHAYEETRELNLANILMHEEVLRAAARELGALPGYHALFTLERAQWRGRGTSSFTSRLRLNEADLSQVTAWIDALKKETERPAEGGRLLGYCWLMLIVGLLARRYGRNVEESTELEMRLARVLSWIEQNYQRAVRVSELAKVAATSERTLLRRFREATGFSPVEYLIRTRIRHAAELLSRRRTGESITEIAFRCGFEDSNYFARRFRGIMGKPPREYGR